MEAKKSSKSPKRRSYRRYSTEFKAEAVRQLERGIPIGELATSLGVTANLLHTWRAKSKLPAALAEQGEEVKRLTKQLKARNEEIEILKKALRIFSRTD